MLKSMIGSIVTKNMAKKLKNSTIQEDDIKDVLREIRITLLDADVNFTVVKNFINNVKAKSIGQVIDKKLSPSDFLLSIIKDELIEVLGKKKDEVNFNKKTNKIMMVGLQGSGKTTTCAKIAQYARANYKKKPLLVACDIYRPAAIDQLKTLANENKFDFYEKGTQNPVQTTKEALKIMDENKNDVIIIDTAGRLQTNQELMDELVNIKKTFSPDEILLVIDSMMGQDAINVITGFHDKLPLTGVILTKLDGDTRGGAALSIRTVVKKPIKFVGTGEKMEAIDPFHPSRMADRILGMGDIVSLVEKAQEQYDEEEARRLQKKIAKNQFDFNDFMAQIQQIKKMGNLKDLASMIPGVGKAIKDIDIDDNAFKGIEAIIQSMTPRERTNPEILNSSRRQRIAKGSGVSIQEVNRLIKQFDQTRKMMKMVTGSKMGKMMANMPKMPGMPGMPKMPKLK